MYTGEKEKRIVIVEKNIDKPDTRMEEMNICKRENKEEKQTEGGIDCSEKKGEKQRKENRENKQRSKYYLKGSDTRQ